MDGLNHVSDRSTSKFDTSKRGTPNKRWKVKYNNLLIPLLVDQDTKGLKCDKSFKRATFSYIALAVNVRFSMEFTAENVENHCRILKL